MPAASPIVIPIVFIFSCGIQVDGVTTHNFDARRALGFKLVEDAIIAMPERGSNDLRKAAAILAHHVDARFETGRGRVLADMKLPCVDPVGATICTNKFTCLILAYQSHGLQGERRLVDQHVVRAASVARSLPEDVGERLADRLQQS